MLPTARASARPAALPAGLLVVAAVLALERTGLAPEHGHVLRGAYGVLAALGLVVLVVGLLVRGLAGTPWGYPGEDGDRDLRIDLVRGLAIAFVVVDHLHLPSLFHLASQEAVGPVSGAELFVALSGVVLGTVSRRRVERAGLRAASAALLRRSLTLYRHTLTVVLGVYLLTLLPGVDGRVVTTYDAGGGTVYDLYGGISHPGPALLRDVLRLQLGPAQFNVMGLYVVLLLVAPLLVLALRRRAALPLLAASWGVWAWQLHSPHRLLPSQFEDAFPLLSWQVLFVTGMALGWHRARLLALARRPAGRAVVAACVLGHLAAVLLAWSNPYLSNGWDVRLGLLPDATFWRVYGAEFARPPLGPGRLVDVWLLLVTLYALLTAYWAPVSRVLGRLVPLGQASLYVFTLQVLACLAVAQVPGLGGGSVALGTLAGGVVLVLAGLAVRHRVLFGLVPR